MATKKTDPFEKFREATLGGSILSDAISGSATKAEDERPYVDTPLPSPAKKSKNENRKLVSFHLDQELYLSLGQVFFLGCLYVIPKGIKCLSE